MSFNNMVLPALGGATIKALCPLPIGEKISISLVEKGLFPVSSVNLSLG